MMGQCIFQGSVPSDLAVVHDFLEMASGCLERHISNHERYFDAKLVISELVVNGALHGNCCSPKKRVSLFVGLQADALRISVRDEGMGVPAVIAPPCSPWSTHGRGLVLVEALCDNLCVLDNEVFVIIQI